MRKRRNQGRPEAAETQKARGSPHPLHTVNGCSPLQATPSDWLIRKGCMACNLLQHEKPLYIRYQPGDLNLKDDTSELNETGVSYRCRGASGTCVERRFASTLLRRMRRCSSRRN